MNIRAVRIEVAIKGYYRKKTNKNSLLFRIQHDFVYKYEHNHDNQFQNAI